MNKLAFPWKNMLAKCILASILMGSLTACVPIMVAGGAVGGGMAATDRRTLGAQTEDKAILLKGEHIAYKIGGNNSHINVTSFNQKVLLTGEVDSEATKQAIGNAIAEIENVESVINELAILAPSSFGSRSNDSLITSKVSASLLAEKNLYSSAFKTVTERGTVYLMGRVTRKEGEHAARVAASVSGVQNVIKVFEYLTEEDLQKLMVLPTSNNTQRQTSNEME